MRNPQNVLRGLAYFTLATLGVVVLLPGCAPAHGSNPPQGRLLVVAVDRSGSTGNVRAFQVDGIDTATTASLLHDRPLELWTFDSEASCIWGPDIPHRTDDLDQALANNMRVVDLKSRHGTRPTLLLEALASDSILHNANNADLIILSDGDSDFYTDRTRFVAAAQTLAKLPGLHVLVAGIHTENRNAWQHAFSALGDRLQLAAQSDLKGSVESLLLKNEVSSHRSP